MPSLPTLTFVMIICIPLLLGGLALWCIFRNVHKKYRALFEQFMEVARLNPEKTRHFILTEDRNAQTNIIRLIAAMDPITKTEILKAGRKGSEVRITTETADKRTHYIAQIGCVNEQWGVTKFIKLN